MTDGISSVITQTVTVTLRVLMRRSFIVVGEPLLGCPCISFSVQNMSIFRHADDAPMPHAPLD
ncbi:hypothetical protein AXA70_07260 [Xanthomonas arboricola pv. juglandis]|nr:hypothetical protein AXA70_07260 [Xanthomonas arboricola pv. juglandis]PMR88081.1 hypothetical protein C1H21_02405 [Xanthomonas arboricola pv. juglandis]